METGEIISVVGIVVPLLVYVGAWLRSSGKYSEKVDIIEKDIREIKESIKKYDGYERRIVDMERSIEMLLSPTPSPAEQNTIGFKSPLTLLEEGVALYKESGAKEYIEKNREDLLKHFEHIDAPFDIQEEAMRLLFLKLREDEKVKDYVYRHPENSIKGVADVAGIALRDIVFEDKGIEQG